MSQGDLLTSLDSLENPKLLVIGDLILDRYTWGNAERVSQEAPVILLRADQREARLGGAANVCQMLRGLEAEVACAGVVGADPDGATVRHLLTDLGVDHIGVLRDHSRPTTVKERFMGRAANRHPHQILRVDSEVRFPLSEEVSDELLSLIKARIDEFQIILISDYGKGVCTPRVLAEVIQLAKAHRIPVVVDPLRGTTYEHYRGATTMTPNRTEASLATGIDVRTPDDAFQAGQQLCQRLDLEFAIVTLDSDGMAVVQPNGSGELFPTRPREVYDITGAGDMVLATIGVALAADLPVAEAVRLANVAGGLEVEHVGVVQITREQMRVDIMRTKGEGAARKIATFAQVQALADKFHEQGRKIVFTNGCFDLLHIGHVTYLEEAAAQGNLLILGLNSDASVRALKGPTRPVRKENERAAVLAALEYVDYVVIFDDETPIDLIKAVRPDVLVKGGDYLHREHEIAGKEFVESYGGRLHLAGLVEGVSTTKILKSVAA